MLIQSSNINIEDLQEKIVERLKTLNPQKIILFGSYATGDANNDSDIDLFLVKDDLEIDELTNYELKAMKKLQDLVIEHKIGFDILSAPTKELQSREDYFYKIDILQKGKVLYVK